jgi:hypothetical protein
MNDESDAGETTNHTNHTNPNKNEIYKKSVFQSFV